MDTQVRSPAGLAPPYRQVCLRSRHNDHRAPFPCLPSATEILPRPRPLYFPAKLLLASPLNPPADRLLLGLFTNLPASDRSLAHERNLITPLHSSVHAQTLLPCYIEEDPSSWPMAVSVVCVLCVESCRLSATCSGGGYSKRRVSSVACVLSFLK